MALLTLQASAKTFSEEELAAFEGLVLAASEVQMEGLRELILNAPVLFRIFQDDMLVGVGGIKVPRRSYQSRVFRLAGVGEIAAQFPLEFGWASVLESQRGTGVGTLIAAAAAKIASVQGGIFATCREENEAIQYVLKKSGFVDIGGAYQSSRGPYTNRLLGLKI